MSRWKAKRPPAAWAWRRGWRRLVALVKRRLEAARKARKAGKTAPKRRRATNPRQPRCTSCRLFVRQLCTLQPDPCGVCPACCPGHTKPPAQEQDGGRFTTSVEKT